MWERVFVSFSEFLPVLTTRTCEWWSSKLTGSLRFAHDRVQERFNRFNYKVNQRITELEPPYRRFSSFHTTFSYSSLPPLSFLPSPLFPLHSLSCSPFPLSFFPITNISTFPFYTYFPSLSFLPFTIISTSPFFFSLHSSIFPLFSRRFPFLSSLFFLSSLSPLFLPFLECSLFPLLSFLPLTTKSTFLLHWLKEYENGGSLTLPSLHEPPTTKGRFI